MSQARDERLAKIQQLREMGVEPYPYRFDRSHHAQDILDRYEELEETEVVVAGRVMTRRKHGKTAFIDLRDESGKIQLYLRKDILGEEGFEIFKQTDIGDFLGIRGKVFKTRTEETTIRVEGIEILSKAINVFPDKFHGVSDTELRYRQRYLDLIMNPEVRETFLTRRTVIDIVREVFNGKGGVEVETPTLQPIYGGASARPFTTHHNKLDTTLYLRIANELYLKRLIVGGFECVYEICKDFRNEGMDKTHNPEFTMVEIYWAYKDYNDMMTLVEELFLTLAERIKGTTTVEYEGVELNFAPPWPRRPMLDLIKEYADVDVAALDDEELRAAVGKLYEETLEDADELAKCRRELPSLNRGNMIDELFGLKVEDHLIQPTFVTDFPKEISPLAKQHRDDPTLTERFELFIAGREIANAFSELNDPIDQRARFEAQMRFLDDGDAEAQPLDEDYLRAMEYGMPPMGGLGIGIDRVTMLFTDQSTIQEVILFPQMRPEKWISAWHEKQAEKKAAKAEAKKS